MNYNTREYKEPLIIHADIAFNPAISVYEKITWGLMLKFQTDNEDKNNTEIGKILGCKKRMIQYHKQALAKKGHCEAVISPEGKFIKYIAVSPEQGTLKKMRRFVKEFSLYFKIKNDIFPPVYNELIAENANHCYYIMAGLEYQYRKTKKEIPYAWNLLNKCFYGAFTPHKDYIDPDWWISEIEKPKRKAAEAVQAKHDHAAKEQEKGDFTEFINGLSKEEYAELKEEALHKMRLNGGVPKGIGAKKLIEFEMFEIRNYV